MATLPLTAYHTPGRSSGRENTSIATVPWRMESASAIFFWSAWEKAGSHTCEMKASKVHTPPWWRLFTSSTVAASAR